LCRSFEPQPSCDVVADRVQRSRPEIVSAGAGQTSEPELFQRSHGVRATRQIAEALGAELGY